jgi:hypothetical protein
LTRLPPALRDWEALLDRFEPDLALSIGPWLARLSLAIGPLHATARAGAGDPDGFSGLARRGPYERLLLAEWAVAEVAPDEFTRRAAMGEHLFLDPHRQEPTGKRRSVVLFDAGPDQLGGPRLVHLAALLVLARRAERAGVPFAFGIVQQQEVRPWTGIERVGDLLGARSARSATPKDVAGWIEHLDPQEGDDLWLVGPPGLQGPASLLHVDEPVEPGSRTVSVEVRPLRLSPRRVQLEPPPPQEAVRLLRDPFARATAAPRLELATGKGAIRFSEDGRRLLGWGARGDIIAWHVPNSPRAAQDGRPRHFLPPKGHQIVAAGLHGRTLCAVTKEPGAFGCTPWPRSIWGRHSPIQEFSPHVPHPEGHHKGYVDVPLATPEGPIPPCWVGREDIGGWKDALVFLDANWGLWRVAAGKTDAERLSHMALAARAMSHGHGTVWVELTEDDRRVVRWSNPVSGAGVDLGEGPDVAFFGYGAPIEHPHFGLVGAPMADGTWRLAHARRGGQHEVAITELRPPSGTVVVGVVADRKSSEAALVVVDADGGALWVLSMRASTKLPKPASRIVAACASAHGPNVAWRTEDGGLCAWSLDHEAYLLRLVPDGRILTPADRGVTGGDAGPTGGA